MAEISRPWDGLVTGDANTAPYDAATEWAKLRMSEVGADALVNKGGVYDNVLNELEVTAGAGKVVVATGRGDVYGTWYENDAALDVTIPTPAASTRIDRIVLRKTWAAQTVRVTRIVGAEGGSAPAMTQSAGVTWDVPLASVSITTGAVITVSSEREFLARGGSSFQDPVFLVLI